VATLSEKEKEAHIFEDLAENPLVSLPVLADNGCIITLDKKSIDIRRDGKEVMKGYREKKTGLWRVKIADDTTEDETIREAANNNGIEHKVNSLMPEGTIAEVVRFIHKSLNSPTSTTLIKAINNGNLAGFPAMTETNIKRYLPKSEETCLGHLDQKRKGSKSTKPKIVKEETIAPKEEIATTISDGKTNFIYAAIVNTDNNNGIEQTGKIFTDQTGKFPAFSSRGYNYILVLYDYDSNAILAEPIKSRKQDEIVKAYKALHAYLTKRGLRPKLQKLDNEASKLLRDEMDTLDVNWQLVPPHIHRRNSAERAIRTFKNHFLAGLAGTDPDFPMHLWDRLVSQTTTTLNLLRNSRINPRLSAEAQLNGQFDYNRTPLAPIGIKVIIHEKPGQKKTWDPHGALGWYLGMAKHHYRCWRIYVTKKASERIGDTVEFFPHNAKMPTLSSADMANRAAIALTEALKNPAPAAPFIPTSLSTIKALDDLAEIFRNSLSATETASPRVGKTDNASPRVKKEENIFQPEHRYPTRHRAYAVQALAANEMLRTSIDDNKIKIDEVPETCILDLMNAIVDPTTGALMEYRHLIANERTKATWETACSNEFGRLMSGLKRGIKGTETMHFINANQVPAGRKVTYARFCCNYRPQKIDEPNRVRITVGGDRLPYEGNVSTKTADLTTIKCLFNSVVSTKNARFCVGDVKNFYLNTPMDRPEYMRIPIKYIPQEIIDEYNASKFIKDGYIYVEIVKGMYGLKQAGLIANQLLEKRLAKYGFAPTKHTHGLWRHETRPIQFALVVDDFGIEYTNEADAQYLLDALDHHYEAVSKDWNGSIFCGISLKWDYKNRTVDLSMPGYINKVLHKFQHRKPTRPVNQPHKHVEPTYGAKIQYAEEPDDSRKLNKEEITEIMQIVGSLLYYARTIDSTLLVALSDIASAQSKGTEETQKAARKLLDYCATHPEAKIRYKGSQMALHIHSDASYLSAPKARSRVGGHFYLGNKAKSQHPNMHNGAILSIAGILKNVMSSAAEAEFGGLFINSREGENIRTTLEELGHKQTEPTPIATDNSTASGIANETIKQQRSKAMDMRFYWIRDRITQKHFLVYWYPGKLNLADYHTKHHASKHHQRVRSTYLQEHDSPTDIPTESPGGLRGCVESTGKARP
jgi:hypothetical protein